MFIQRTLANEMQARRGYTETRTSRARTQHMNRISADMPAHKMAELLICQYWFVWGSTIKKMSCPLRSKAANELKRHLPGTSIIQKPHTNKSASILLIGICILFVWFYNTRLQTWLLMMMLSHCEKALR